MATIANALPALQVRQRLDRLRETLDDAEVDALLVTTLANVRYLTGFSGSAALLVVTADRALLTTDGRYRTQSAEQVAAAGVGDVVDIEIGGAGAQRDAVRSVVEPAPVATLGLEAEDVSWASAMRWTEHLDGAVEVRRTAGVVEELREVKDDGEIARMLRAAAIADGALGEVLPLLSSATERILTEAELALALDTAMRRGGADGLAFETIVASGPNSAKPHHEPGERVIRAGDAVVIDFGAMFEGYRSDMTRTFCVGGPPTGELATVFEVVAESQRLGVAQVEPGVTTGSVDRVCRDAIAASGWADRFEHGTGHGVGLDIHEGPSVGPGSTAILEPGTVVTVEPGVYLPGTGGVRIEDTLVVTEHGSRSLTRFPKEVAV